MNNNELLRMQLELCVPLRIHEYKQMGGPSDLDFARIRNEYPQYIGSHGDAILFREKDTTTRAVNMLVDGVAVLSFVPGGVTLFGMHFETKIEEESEAAV
jgi:hypothetical protein